MTSGKDKVVVPCVSECATYLLALTPLKVGSARLCVPPVSHASPVVRYTVRKFEVVVGGDGGRDIEHEAAADATKRRIDSA